MVIWYRLDMSATAEPKQPKAEPSPEQLRAIRKYAKENGRTWKTQLLDDWMHARQPGYLQQVRNQFGPTWLKNFRLKGEDEA